MKSLLSIFILLSANHAFAQARTPFLPTFAAPMVNSVSGLPGDVPFGQIVYDNSTGNFKGYVNAGSGNTAVWQNLSLTAVRSQITAGPTSGYGSAIGNLIRTWSNVTTTGSDITYTPSASNSNNGDKFTINTQGLYSISYCDQFNASKNLAVTKNDNTLTTGVLSLARGIIVQAGNTSGINYATCVSANIQLNVNDVITAHSDGVPSGLNTIMESFSITRIN